ncbi:TetR/AcrR family transcriptional regulator C-terminal domain-containing protein [Sphingomonas psychrotolerans]|uniref:TetR/AcrR family transcriptional regulator C-terminal domain-containing protein n=1 Tax=Sphingomonas psychrotolerans TaxID=1327635 RepID=A0ABU3N462_9SPHN|nr:TetR/AcrR family transcriptional regulator C-terminal domain-containing protein [Sphingomonas psychrotolerans]MDT8759328.1 TetR/AcrR family transcriptional regulator C-terminal domain-containing protein [Sphingomonas psychrotolerans]
MEKAPGKREARKEERRLAILDVAKRAFLESGYSAASMSAISAELGGSKGTLWNYFPSKEELFAAVLEHATAAYRQQLNDLLAPSADLWTTVVTFCRSFITKITSPEAVRLHRLIAAEAGRFPELGEIFYRRAPEPTLRILAEFFAGQMAAGHMRADDPAVAARALACLCMGGLHQRVIWGIAEPTVDAVESETHAAADVFAHAYDIGRAGGA